MDVVIVGSCIAMKLAQCAAIFLELPTPTGIRISRSVVVEPEATARDWPL